MKLIAHIDSDCQKMERYFEKLFTLLQETIIEDENAPVEVFDADADFSQATFHSISHLIKPDMIINIYSLIDFWMVKICKYQKDKKNLSLKYKDIKGESDLDARHKYLTVYVKLDLSSVQDSYKRLDELRNVRNAFIHGGGHVESNKERKFSSIDGITLSYSLINIDESFIWDTLEHAKKYLQKAVQASSCSQQTKTL
jgi:hypothetical protein